MNQKKILAILFIVAILLAGCTPSAAPEEPSTPVNPSTEPTTPVNPSTEPTTPVNNNPNVEPIKTGLTAEEIYAALCAQQYFYGPDGYALGFYADHVLLFIENSGFMESGVINSIDYDADTNKLGVKTTVPAFAGNEMMDPYDAYDVNYDIYYDLEKADAVKIMSGETNVGIFTLRPYEEQREAWLEDGAFEMYFTKRLRGNFYGQKDPGGSGYEYFLNMYLDENQIDSGIFGEKAAKRVIYSEDITGKFTSLRIYDYVILDSSIASQYNGHWVEIIDMKTGTIILTFEDVDLIKNFDYTTGNFTLMVGKAVDAFSEIKYDSYHIVPSGVYKVNP